MYKINITESVRCLYEMDKLTAEEEAWSEIGRGPPL